MRITHIALDHFLTHAHWKGDFTPLTVIAGPNEAGKSSIADAVSFVLTGDPGRVKVKGRRAELLTDGATSGHAILRSGDAALTREVSDGKLTPTGKWPLDPEAPRALMPYLLTPAAFRADSPDDRRRVLLTAMKVLMAPDRLRQELAERGHMPAHIEQLPVPENPAAWSIEDWIKLAGEKAAEARGAWKALTKEAYGTKKAETWAAQVPADTPEEADLEAARAAVTAADAAWRAALETVGTTKAAAAARASYTAMTEAAGAVDDLRAALASRRSEAATANAALTAARADRDAVDARAPAAAKDCPHCKKLVLVTPAGNLTAYSPPAEPANVAEQAAARRVVAVAEQDARAAADKVEDAERALNRAAGASDALRSKQAPAEAALTVEEAEEGASFADEALTVARKCLAALTAAMTAKSTAETATQAAAAYHRDVLAWLRIAEALAPSGIPGDLLRGALERFNDTLREHATLSGFKQVTITGDMAILVGGRTYDLMSDSAQWRADATIAAALAEHTGLKFLVLDRFDVLEITARGPTLTWLRTLTAAGRVDTAIVVGTFSAPPQCPADVAVHWLGRDADRKAA